MDNMLDTILGYVDKVLSGASTPDNAFGRSLLDMVHSVPKMTTGEFEEMLNSNRKVNKTLIGIMVISEIINFKIYFQDLLMVLYLSQLTKTQLLLNEKLTLLTIQNGIQADNK